MFYKKTIENLKTDKNVLAEHIAQIQLENEEKRKKIENLEKRINIISDYIQGNYTKQINQNFAEIEQQIKLLQPMNNK